MLDRWTTQWVQPPLTKVAALLNKSSFSPDHITLTGFVAGMLAIPLLASQLYLPALVMILVNRVLDGLDGALARLQSPSDAGGFLDITLDFIFYAGVVLGFALSDPQSNALASSLLMFSFMGTGASFLAFGIMAQKHAIKHSHFGHKSLYYLGGLAEGTETIVIFVLFCLFPQHFPWLATVFAVICIITAMIRVCSGYQTIKQAEVPTLST
ncbi:CDP-alcohol phosphatidyltransferase family protein [Candidatus Sororendozoicomonas aggregata]|uniref:CDP-alcohol phosphatidyltransferase family protein n=1 Tax=Candidatus Sororendozoicomonas aggregata TaxID=3073239 RepID=UPI002ED46E25